MASVTQIRRLLRTGVVPRAEAGRLSLGRGEEPGGPVGGLPGPVGRMRRPVATTQAATSRGTDPVGIRR